MIALPPGVTVNYEVMVVLNSLPEEFLEWWKEMEGCVGYTSYYNARGQEISTPQIHYGLSRPSHKMAGSDEYLVRFRQEDAGMALALLMKWDNLIISHNMREMEKYVY